MRSVSRGSFPCLVEDPSMSGSAAPSACFSRTRTTRKKTSLRQILILTRALSFSFCLPHGATSVHVLLDHSRACIHSVTLELRTLYHTLLAWSAPPGGVA